MLYYKSDFSSVLSGKKSHKSMDDDANSLMKLYYSSRVSRYNRNSRYSKVRQRSHGYIDNLVINLYFPNEQLWEKRETL